MPFCPRPLASRLATTEDELREMASHEWISITKVQGTAFISGRNEYQAKFILHLRHKLALADKEIDRVLKVQKPPYSLKGIPATLDRGLKKP